MTSSNESVQDVIDRACAKLELTVKDMGVNLALTSSNISELEDVLLAVRDMADESALSGACFMAAKGLAHLISPLSVGRRFFPFMWCLLRGKGYTKARFTTRGLESGSLRDENVELKKTPGPLLSKIRSEHASGL